MYILSPSILSADFSKLGEELKKIENAGCQYVHIDVMDGSFVPSISFGMPVMKSIRQSTKCVFDVHLMIEEPGRYLDAFQAAGADIITVHAEACKHLHRTIMAVKDLGLKPAVALNPATPLSAIEYVLEDLDMVLIMSVNPGFGGQSFIPFTLEKVKKLKKMITERNLHTDIEVDGGVNRNNVKTLMDAGANVFVAGTAVFGGDVKENVAAFQNIFGE